ncbi:hypothetical protein HanRHA438_Chr12g0566891 [Helianthus annuus]|nr:hypothetical protein HanRHA438_Chr12g0566891 [Helianthus annuus]
MWLPKSKGGVQDRDPLPRKGASLVGVAIDKDKYSPHALKWSIEHLLICGQTVVLIHFIRKNLFCRQSIGCGCNGVLGGILVVEEIRCYEA